MYWPCLGACICSRELEKLELQLPSATFLLLLHAQLVSKFAHQLLTCIRHSILHAAAFIIGTKCKFVNSIAFVVYDSDAIAESQTTAHVESPSGKKLGAKNMVHVEAEAWREKGIHCKLINLKLSLLFFSLLISPNCTLHSSGILPATLSCFFFQHLVEIFYPTQTRIKLLQDL